MAEPSLEIQKQLVAVVLARPGDAHGFLHDAHRTGHDAYPESSPDFALKTLETQHKLYGFVNAVVVDVSMFGKATQVAPLREFSSAVREISMEVPIIGYSSIRWRGVQLRALTIFGIVDGFVAGQKISPEGVLNVYPQAVNRRMPQAGNIRSVA